jgi:hypothetical protein
VEVEVIEEVEFAVDVAVVVEATDRAKVSELPSLSWSPA